MPADRSVTRLPNNGGGWVAHAAAAVLDVSSGGDLDTRPDVSCLRLHRGRHARDGLRRPANHRNCDVIAVRVPVRTDASIVTEVRVLPPGSDPG